MATCRGRRWLPPIPDNGDLPPEDPSTAYFSPDGTNSMSALPG